MLPGAGLGGEVEGALPDSALTLPSAWGKGKWWLPLQARCNDSCLGSEAAALPAPTPGTYTSWLSLSEGSSSGRENGGGVLLCVQHWGPGWAGVGRPLREWGFLVLGTTRDLCVTLAHTLRNEEFLKFYPFPDYPLLR